MVFAFRKVRYVPINNLKLQGYSTESILTLPIFSEFQLWSQNLAIKFNKFCITQCSILRLFVNCKDQNIRFREIEGC
jgi:hypothetical protein